MENFIILHSFFRGDILKYVTKIIPVVCILVATIISIIFLDFSQSKEYLNLSGYQRDSIRINYSDDIIINDKTMQKVLLLVCEK